MSEIQSHKIYAWVEILEKRKVFKNNRISINGKSYALPPGFVGTRL